MPSRLNAPSPLPNSRNISVSTRGTPANRSIARLAREAIRRMYRRKPISPRSRKHRSSPARRWKVERTHSWLNRARRLLIRWEKKVANYLGFLHLQFAIVTLRTAGVLG